MPDKPRRPAAQKQPKKASKKKSPRTTKPKAEVVPVGSDLAVPVEVAPQSYEIAIEKPKHAGGAATKRTPDRREAILSCLRTGMSLAAAAEFAGMHFDTLNEWRKADSEFSDAVEKARHVMEWEMLERIRIAADDPKNWPAAAWKLERMMPEKYARKFQPLQMAADNGPMEMPGKLYKVAIQQIEPTPVQPEEAAE